MRRSKHHSTEHLVCVRPWARYSRRRFLNSILFQKRSWIIRFILLVREWRLYEVKHKCPEVTQLGLNSDWRWCAYESPHSFHLTPLIKQFLMVSLLKHRALTYMSSSHSFNKWVLGSDAGLGAEVGSQHMTMNRVGVLALTELTQ